MPDAPRIVAIRGATTVENRGAGHAEAVLDATRTLLEALVAANGLDPARIISAFFTVTPDLQVAFPAEAARMIGWRDVPLLCAVEIDVPGALSRCIRVLLHVEQSAPPRHVYLNGARELRPDLHYE